MMKHPAKFCEKEGVKVGEVAAGGVAATAICSAAAKVIAPCLETAAEEAIPVAVPVMEAVAEDV